MSQISVDHLIKLSYRLTREDWAAFEHLPRELIGREKLYALLPFIIAGICWASCTRKSRALFLGQTPSCLCQ